MTRKPLSQLLSALPDHRELAAHAAHAGRAAADPLIERVVCDSRRVRPGDLFVAVRGAETDGHAFLAQAVARGAAAVVVERAEAAPAGVPAVQVPGSREAVALLAHEMLGRPTQKIAVCGVTGTNGKTTTTYLARSIFEASGLRTGLIGTISYQVGGRELAAPTTTPGPVQLAEHLAEMVRRGTEAALMEVSSHALDQGRTLGVNFRAAAFTNLTPEHLDYHRDMPAYRRAKSRLFEQLGPEAVAVLNRDDEASESFASVMRGRTIWYAIDGRAEIRARQVRAGLDGARFTLCLGGERHEVRLQLIGRHNVYNALAAAGLALALDLPRADVVKGLESLAAVPGRLEAIRCGQPFAVLVDYAHTEDALENSLRSVASLTPGRLIVVFGCGGDRDRGKRPRMAAVAERLAEVVIVTSDNPRTEEPGAIADEIFAGFKSPGAVVRELDRGAAIGRAIEMAAEGDTVVIAGKGHEDYQIIGREGRCFDDRQQARQVLRACGFDQGWGRPA